MSRPKSPEYGVTFDIAGVVDDLKGDDVYEREGHIARTLVRTPDLRVVVVVLDEGKRMEEHDTDVTALVHTISGRVRLQLPDRRVELAAGQLLALGPGLRHDVEALADSVVMLTLGWDASAAPVAGSEA